MQNVLLIVLLLLALSLIGVVLLQRNEGGGLGLGGGGGGGSMSQRSAATAMTKLTWVLGTAFMVVSLALTIIAAGNSEGTSVIDRIGNAPVSADEPATAPTLDADSLLPPPTAGEQDAPLVPRAD